MTGGAEPGADGGAPDFGTRAEFYTFAPESLGQDLPQFEVRREVGKGSMGIVYEAVVRATGQRIALKILPPSLQLTERALARFLREGRIMARIRHPDIVACLDQGRQGRLHWFAMEFVDGVTLQERLQVGPLPVQQACRLIAQAARALQFAHDHGVVHRDLKPGNLILRDPAGPADPGLRVAITDFGLARETGSGSMTESGALVGTPMFMAPEQVLGGSAEASTLGDVYSLGATLYALLTGQPPFDGPTAQSVLKAVLEQAPRRPRRLRADLPPPVEAIVLKAMEREPERRYGSALEFAEDLERWLQGAPVQARLPNPAQRLWRLSRQHPLASLLLLAVVALLAGARVLVVQRDRSAVEQSLAEAERCLALAATSRDEQDRPRGEAERRDLLLAAVAHASTAIQRDDGVALAWFVRARANHRLRHYAEAIYDLDAAERRRGAPTPEILHFRIDALRQQGDAASMRRLQHDLTALLALDPGPHTRALVAEHLLDLAASATGQEQAEALRRARDVLAPVGDDDPRAAVARARVREREGDVAGALGAMRDLRVRHEGNLYVHLQAAAMFDRHGLADESAREHEMARILQPVPDAPPQPNPVDLDGLGQFLGDVDRLLRALTPAAPAGQPPPRKD